MLGRLRECWRSLKRRGVYGAKFKRYAPQNPPAQVTEKPSIAICYLIPLLGDTVLLFPLVDAIAREHPEAQIVAFVSGAGCNLGLHPAVSRVYKQPSVPLVAWFWPINVLLNLYLWWRRELREVRAELLVMPRGGFDPYLSAFLAWMIGGRERVGFTSEVEPERSDTDLKPSALLTREVKRLRGVHELERGSDVLKLAGVISEPIDVNARSAGLISVSHRAEGRAVIKAHPELQGRYIVLSPGASLPRKQWPTDRFVELVRELLCDGLSVVLVGGRDAEEACAIVAEAMRGRTLNLCSGTTFAELTAVCAGAELFIGNDSGPAHVAGLCGVPTLVISAYSSAAPAIHQTSPQRIHPGGPFVSVVQPRDVAHPCTDECLSTEGHCILGVDVPQVKVALRGLLSRSGRLADFGLQGVN